MQKLSTRAVTKYDLILPQALWQKLVFCTQMDTRIDTDRQMDGQTG